MRALLLVVLSGCALAQQYVISTVAGGAPPPSMAAARASIGDPARVAVDTAGNVYFASLHSIFRIDASGALTRFAGNGRAGNAGDGGSATSAQLNDPMGMTFDSAGNLYVADRGANVVRKISGGIISTVPVEGLKGPFAVAVDGFGNIYVADTGNNRVVRVSATSSQISYGGIGLLNGPEGVAVDGLGNIYIADTFNGRVKRVDPGGTLVNVAGTGSTGVFSGDNGPAQNASLSLPTDITFDTRGNLYIADFGNARIRKIANGTITTVAGNTSGVPILDGEEAVSVRLEGPTGMAVDRNGVIYFAEGGLGSGTGLAKSDYKIWKIASTGVLTTLAGIGVPSYSGDNGAPTAAQLNGATAISIDGIGNLFIVDTENHRVRRVDTDGVITTVLGNGTPGFAVDFGSPAGALVRSPRGVVADASGAIYVADTLNHRVRKYQPGGNVFTYAGIGNAAYFGDEGPANRASLNQPEGLALDAAGNLYIADVLDNVVRKVTTDGVIHTIAGSGLSGFSGDGGKATAARLNGPRAVAVDAAGNLYVADTGNNRIRRIDAQGNIGTVATATAPRGIAADRDGNVYFSDTATNRIRKLYTSGAVASIAGDGTCCYTGDFGLATDAKLNQPVGLWVDGPNVYVADSGNSAVRVLRPIVSTLSISAVTNGASGAVGPVAPGELVTIYGTGLDTAKSVLFNGAGNPVLYATTNQAGVVVPTGITGASAQVVVQSASAIASPFAVAVAAVAPGVFTADGSGRGQPAGVTGSFIAGDVITLYITGQGQNANVPVTVTIGGVNAEVQYAGPAQGVSDAVMQVKAVVPDRVFGTQPVVVSVGGVPSQSGVTVVVR